MNQLHQVRGETVATSGVCNTPACIRIASEILFSLAPNYADIDPCSNFGEYACAGWEAQHTIPEGSGTINALTAPDEANRIVIRDILESPYPNASATGWITTTLTPDQVAVDVENFDLLQSAYNACLNKTEVKTAGIAPLLEVLSHIADLLPVHQSNCTKQKRNVDKRDHAAIGETILFFEQLGIPTLQSLTLLPGEDDPTQYTLTVSPPASVPLPDPKLYLSNETRLAYGTVMAKVLQGVLPGKIDEATAGALAAQILGFELAILSVFLTATIDTTANNVKVSLEEASQSAPELGLDYVVSILSGDFPFDQIVLNEPTYFANVSVILAETPVEVLQGYFVWRAISVLSKNIISPETAPWTDFLKVLNGDDPEVSTPRWKECIERVDNGVQWLPTPPSGLGWILSRFFVEASYTPEAKEFTDQILTNIRQEFLVRLEEKDWIEEPTKKIAAEKVNAVLQMVGYPDDPKIVDPQALKEYYTGLEVGESHFDNMLAFARHSTARRWADVKAPVSRFQWIQTSPTVNAYYFPPLNEIVVPAGIQQFPAFSTDFPSYIAYGSMGSICGHELTHGFDNNGRKYGPDGKLVNWWTDLSLEGYVNRTKCFVEQYNAIPVEGPNGETLHVDGEKTLGENIADAGGIALAYGAWSGFQNKQKRSNAPTDGSLPGLEKFTNAQLFFLRWGQTWCSRTTPEYLASQLLTDPHAPDFARVITPLENSKGFREAFNCPVKEPTCELW